MNVRVLALSSVWPQRHGHLEAANVVCYEILLHLAKTGLFDLRFGLVRLAESQLDRTTAAEQGMRDLVSAGVAFLPPIRLPSPPRRRRWSSILRGVVLARPEDLLPGVGGHREIDRVCGEWRPEAILTVWSELATAAAAGLRAPKFAYYGNPDHKVAEAMLEFERCHRADSPSVAERLRLAARRLSVWALRRAHLKVMRRQSVVGDVAYNDALFYRRHGCPKARYIRNLWPAPESSDWERIRDEREQIAPLKIVGNVGNLSATGNTYGIHTLVTQVLPHLKSRLGEGTFEVHLFGGRRVHPLLAPLVSEPHIRLRGFVEDLNAEILSAPIFLVANNHSQFKVGHTRFLHAWSLGACVTAFRDSAEAMPEIEHGKNALLASDPVEMAEIVAQAAANVSLRRAVGRGGMATLREAFEPGRVTGEIAEELVALARGGSPVKRASSGVAGLNR